jgi:hypothetical protein
VFQQNNQKYTLTVFRGVKFVGCCMLHGICTYVCQWPRRKTDSEVAPSAVFHCTFFSTPKKKKNVLSQLQSCSVSKLYNMCFIVCIDVMSSSGNKSGKDWIHTSLFLIVESLK